MKKKLILGLIVSSLFQVIDTSVLGISHIVTAVAKEGLSIPEKSIPVTAKESSSETMNVMNTSKILHSEKNEALPIVRRNLGTDIYSITNGGMVSELSDADLIKDKLTATEVKSFGSSFNNNLSAYDETLYALSGGKLYKLPLDSAKPEVALDNFSSYSLAASAIDQQGNLVGYTVINSKPTLFVENLAEKIPRTKVITFNNSSDVAKLTANGDAAIDADNNFWKISYNTSNKKAYLQQIDIETATVKKTIEVIDPESKVYMEFASIAFLSNDELVLSGKGNTSKVDLATGRIRLIDQTFSSYDFASLNTPHYGAQPVVELTNSLATQEVYQRNEIEYTYKVSNDGNLVLSNAILKSELPEGVEYVKGSTTLNGKKVADVQEQSPLFAGMKVNSASSADGIVSTTEPATVTFKVKVKEDAPVNSSVITSGVLTAENFTDDQAIRSNTDILTIKGNRLSLEVQDSTIEMGSTWQPQDNFISATDIDGNPINFDAHVIEVEGKVFPNQMGKYPLTYRIGDVEKKVTVTVRKSLGTNIFSIINGGMVSQLSDADLIKDILTVTDVKNFGNTFSNNLSAYDNALYSETQGKLYKLPLDGSDKELILNDLGNSSFPAVAMDQQGNFIGFTFDNNKPQLLIENLNSRKKHIKNITFKNQSDASKLTENGDAAVDADNNLWKISYNTSINQAYLQQIDLTTATVEKTIEVVDPEKKVDMGFSSMAFLSNGEMVLSGKDTTKIDLSTGQIHLINRGFSSYDFASLNTPHYGAQPKVELTDSLATQEVYQRKEIEYTYKVSNTGNLALSNTILKSELPTDVEYIKGSTTLNGQSVADVENNSPLVKGLQVNSAASAAGVVSVKEPAVVTFKVKVKKDASPDTTITMQGTLTAEGFTDENKVVSNIVTHKIKENKCTLNVKDLTIPVGSTWQPKDNFVSATDIDGNSVAWDPVIIKVAGNVDPAKADDYEVTYTYEDVQAKANVHVIPGELSFSVPKNLVFENTKLSGQRQLVSRENMDWQISVVNTTKTNWQLKAQATKVINSNNALYKDVLVFVDNQGNEHSLSETNLVAQGTTNETSTMIKWAKDQGVLFVIDPTVMKADTYTGQINWSLEDAP